MAVNYQQNARSARMTGVRDLLNGGKLEILDGAAVLVTYTLNGSSGSVSNDTLTFSFASTVIAATGTGTADGARFRTSANADVVTGLTVGTAATDIIIDNTNINSGQNIELTSVTLTHG